MATGRRVCHDLRMALPRHRSLTLLAAILVAGTSLAARHATSDVHAPVTLLVRVVDAASRLPLPNAEVTAARVRRLTDASGNARFTWPADGTLNVRVRQIGFRYADRTLHRGSSPTASEDTVVVALTRSAFALPQVETVVDSRCPRMKDSASLALSTSSMELLRFGAEQYDNFRAAYPFDVTLVRRTVRDNSRYPGKRVEVKAESTNSGGYGDVYRAGNVLQRTSDGYFVPLLFVSTLADSTFWSRHCFAARGVESRDGHRVIRLDFFSTRDVREVEWEGSAWLDSAESVLRRVDFRLAHLQESDAPRRFEGYTIFSVPSPFIAVPDSTVAWWWSWYSRDPTYSLAGADVQQALTVRDLTYRRAVPPPFATPPVSPPPRDTRP
jgi:hypothetical protein